MAATTRKDMAWLQTGWEQNQGHSSQMRHYRAPAPCQKGASRNSLLQCNKMSVKAKKVDDKARQIRFKYGKSNLERELNKKKGIDMTPFVTKVQIRKTQERNRFNSAGRDSAKRRIESERFQSPFIENSEENITLNSPKLNVDFNDKESFSTLKTVDEKDEEEIMLREDIIAVEVNEKKMEDNYLYPETSEKQLDNVQHLIKCLTRKLRDPFEASRKQIPSTRPIATYARPTKGEIALSIKGPVLLAPVSKVAMTTVQSHGSDRPSRLNTRSLPEFAGSRTERARTRPISSVSDSVVVTGKKLHGPVRGTWVDCGHAQNDSHDQRYRLCYSCKDQYRSGSDAKITHERAKSAVFRDVTLQSRSDGCLPQLIRQTPTKLHNRNAGNHSASPKRSRRSRNGMVSPFELQVHLDELNSYDYGSPVPPPSVSNSDDEELTI
ncbi:hypothetical protein ACROYT_G011325 [Oculina patagonica]